MLRAYRKLHTLREETRFRSWFFAVLLSVHRSRCRRAFWKRFLPLEDATCGGREPVGEDGRPKHEEIQSARRVARALARLPAVQREALVLHEIEGFSMEEIAAMQEVTVSAVKSRVLRGRERLRRHYRALGFGEPAPAAVPPPGDAGSRSPRSTIAASDAFSPVLSSVSNRSSRQGGRHE